MKQLKRVVYYVWIAAIVLLLGFFVISPESFEPAKMAAFLERYQEQAFLVYVLISLLRGLFLIPSTPFVICGAILFPQMPLAVFTVSMLGVLLGSTLIYFFSDLLGFSEKLERKYPKQLEKWHRRLNSPKATLIVIAWSFFPLVPTDLICYVAGIVKMPYKFLILGVFIGELVLIYFYVYLGTGLFDYFAA
ncbi:MAG: VTT domain-containing protein [Flavobacteriales bacterium]|jgi:uncharacterized membrane protein YdjX (TVP38/TMEM64 family)|nr:VTT domain-containing protein [Flavobacteriales bacterium]